MITRGVEWRVQRKTGFLKYLGYDMPHRYCCGENGGQYYFPLLEGEYNLGPDQKSFLLDLVINALTHTNSINPHAFARHVTAKSVLERIKFRMGSGNCGVTVQLGRKFGEGYNGYIVVDFEEIERDVYVPLYVLLGEAIRGMGLGTEGKMKGYLSAVSEKFGKEFAAFVAVVANPYETNDYELTRLINDGNLDSELAKKVKKIRETILVEGRKGKFVSVDPEVHAGIAQQYGIKPNYFPIASKMRDRLVLPTVLSALINRAKSKGWDNGSINPLMEVFSEEGYWVINDIVTVYEVHQEDRAEKLARILPGKLKDFRRYLSALKILIDSDHVAQGSQEFQELISNISTWIGFYESFGVTMDSLRGMDYQVLLQRLRGDREDGDILNALFNNTRIDEEMRRLLFSNMVSGIVEVDENFVPILWDHMKNYPQDRCISPDCLKVLIQELQEIIEP